MSVIEREYLYRPRWWSLLFGIVLFSLSGITLAHLALTDNRKLIIDYFIELSPTGAAIFYWVLSGLSFVLVIFSATFGLHRVLHPRTITLTADWISAPKRGAYGKDVIVKYGTIQDLSIITFKRQQYLQLTHPDGKLSVMASLLPSREAFGEICELVAERVRDAQTV